MLVHQLGFRCVSVARKVSRETQQAGAIACAEFHDLLERILAAARRHGLGVRVWRDPNLGLDVDVPDDLATPAVEEVLAWRPTSPANLR